MKNAIPFFDSDLRKILGIPDQRQYEVFLQYKRFVEYLDGMDTLGRVLEMGSGYSTVLLALFAEKGGCEVNTVDVSFDTVNRAVTGTIFEPFVKRNIHFLQGATVSAEEFNSYFAERFRQKIGNVGFRELKLYLNNFIVKLIDMRKWDKLAGVLGHMPNVEELINMFITDEGITFPQEIKGIYRQKGDEFDMYGDSNTSAVRGVIDPLLKDVNYFDAIFFDCGEFSGFPEWEKLHDAIRPGGVAIFHDIYFPKSFKNFMICASVMADPKWKVEHIDKSTPQGMMIARKKLKGYKVNKI